MVIPIALAAAMTSDGFGAGSICMSLGAAGIGAIWAVVNSAYNKKRKEDRRKPGQQIFRVHGPCRRKMKIKRSITVSTTGRAIPFLLGNFWNLPLPIPAGSGKKAVPMKIFFLSV